MSVAADAGVEFPTVRAGQITVATDARWLIEAVWSVGVGIIGASPKCSKTFLGLDMAISVASGTPFLGRFEVHDRGPTLIYLAEDALDEVRKRVAGICAHRALDLAALDLHVITAPAVRLDRACDQERLVATVARIKPKMLVLDPLVRLHSLNENRSEEISALLGYLRELQRAHDLAVVLVHHMAKHSRPQLGQALRGSGDLHAWVDHGAYITKTGDKLRLTFEHRTAPQSGPLDLRLVADDAARAHLEIVDDTAVPSAAIDASASPQPSLAQLVVTTLRRAQRSMSRGELRVALRVGNNRLGAVLGDLETQGRILRSGDGVSLPG